VPAECVANTAFVVAGDDGLCDAGAVYFLCDGSTFNGDYVCSVPAGYTLVAEAG
jgi:hypothetical protein